MKRKNDDFLMWWESESALAPAERLAIFYNVNMPPTNRIMSIV